MVLGSPLAAVSGLVGAAQGVAHEVARRVGAGAAGASGGSRPRRVTRVGRRLHVEVRGTTGPAADRLVRDVHAALLGTAGVEQASVNAVLGVAVVVFDEAAVGVDELLRTVAAAEARHATGPERAPSAPDDPSPLQRQLLALGVDVVAAGVTVAGNVLRLPRLPMEAMAALGFVDATPRLRRPLERTFGQRPVDAAMGLALTVTRGLAYGVSGVVADLAMRTVLVREADARLRSWYATEERLLAASPDVVLPIPGLAARPERPSGPADTYSNRSAAVGATAAGFAYAGSSNGRRAMGILTAGTAKAARMGTECFAGSLGRILAGHAVTVLDPDVLRLLGRVDAVVIDGSAVSSDHAVVTDAVALVADVTAAEIELRATELLDPRRPTRVVAAGGWRIAPPDDIARIDAERVRAAVRHGRSGGAIPLAVLRGDTLVGVATATQQPHPMLDAVVVAARRVGQTVLVGVPREVGERLGVARAVADPRRLGSVVRGLQQDGRVVAVVAGRAGSWWSADVGIGVVVDGRGPPWGAGLLCGPGLAEVVTTIEAMAAARAVERRSVQFSAYGSSAAALLAFTGPARTAVRRASTAVDVAALASMADGVWSARRLETRALPPSIDATPWHALTAAAVLDRLGTRPGGLPEAEAAARHAATTPRPRIGSGFGRASLEGLATPLTPPLATGAGVSAVLGSLTDAALIGTAMTVNVVIGSLQQVGAERALRRLVHHGEVRVRLVRDGHPSLVGSDQLVPGDVIELVPGDAVPADCRVLDAAGLEVDESSLTGESFLVTKTSEPVSARAIADRRSMLYQGTVVAAGTARAAVIAVGARTEAGRSAWAGMSARRRDGVERRLDELTRVTIPVALGGAVLVVAAGLLHGRGLRATLTDGVGLAVAAVPEGLPLVATVAQLAAGRRLSRRGALVRRSATMEALGRVDALCFDKTGTLTEGRISLHGVSDLTAEEPLSTLGDRHRRVLAAALRATPEPHDGGSAPHPTDGAVVAGAASAGVGRDADRPGWRRVGEHPFEPSRGYHATLGRVGDHGALSVKGAPEVLLPRCTSVLDADGERPLDDAEATRIRAHVTELALQGRRVLAVAERGATGHRDLSDSRVRGLCLVGLVVLSDPIRTSAAGALRALRRAGVDVVMLTGDHPSTAQSIAAELGMTSDRPVITGTELDAMSDHDLAAALATATVFARVTPVQKVRIVRALRHLGRVVAVTGDGANDAAAIRMADVGIALGRRGTNAAREAADLVVTDDRLETITDALIEGRALWGAVRDAIAVLVGGNLGEIGFVLLASAIGSGRSSLNARQLLLVNLLTDMIPSMALAVRPPVTRDPEQLMREGPQRSLGRRLDDEIAARAAATMCAATLGWLAARPTGTGRRAATVALVALVGAQLAQTLVAGRRSPLVIAASIGSAAALTAVVQTPGVSQFFGCRPLGPVGWLIAGTATGTGAALAPLAQRADLADRLRSGLDAVMRAAAHAVTVEPGPTAPAATTSGPGRAEYAPTTVKVRDLTDDLQRSTR